MATAAAAHDGGIGGKFRKRPFRRAAAATPYDRHPSAARIFRGNPVAAAAAEEEGRNGWLSKLVDPASRLITRTATRFFSSVFRKRLGAPPVAPEATLESREAVTDVVSINPLPDVQEGGKDEESSKKVSDGDGISELEQLLKQKTFTRVEFDRLSELLRSRTVDLSEEDAKKTTESKTLPPAVDYKKQETLPVSAEGREIETSKFFESISTPSVSFRIPQEEVASPAELAKAYMYSRPSKVSPSSTLQSQAIREAASLPGFVPFAPRPPDTSIAPRSVFHFSRIHGYSESGYSTPRSQGRSAMYKMSRSPYFKGETTVKLKAAEPTADVYSPLTSAKWTSTSMALSSGKQALKRRSSALESDLGSIGPIRRIRQKSTLVSPSKDDKESGDLRVSGAGFTSVPPQSSEMARKILQQLDKLVPSPKGKSSEVKAIAVDDSPHKLTVDMLSGWALKSVEVIDSSNVFHVEANGKLDVTDALQSRSPTITVSQKRDKVKENGPSKPTISGPQLAFGANGMVGVRIPAAADTTMPGMKPPDSVFLGSAAAPPKKPAFKMQAPEDDTLELDEDGSVDASALPITGKEKLESTVSEEIFAISETAIAKKAFTISSEDRPISIFSSSQGAEEGVSDGLVVAEKGVGFAFQVAHSSSALSQPPPTPTMPSPLVEKLAPSEEQTAVPVFGFGTEGAPTLTFSSTITSFSHPRGLNFGAKSESQVQLLGSSYAAEKTMPTAPVEATTSGKGDKIQRAGYLSGESISSGLSTTTPSVFGFASSTISSQSNGSVKSTSSLFSVSAAPVTSLSGSSISPSIAISSATTSSAPVAITAPTFPPLPPFQFGADSTVVTSLASSLAGKSESADLISEPVKESPFGIAGSAPEASSTLSSTVSSIFGFSASAPPGATPSGTTESLSVTQATQSGSGISLFTQNTSGQLGSSASSPTFGLTGSSSLGLTSSAFGASTSSAKLFGSSSVFGQSPAISFTTSAAGFSSSLSSSSTASAVATSNLLGSGTQTATSSIFGCGFDSTPSSSSTGFSMSPAASASAPVSFGASSGSIFSFTSAATATPSAAVSATAPLSFGSSSASVFSFTSAASATSPAVPTFGLPTPAMGFSSGAQGNDQMNEDSMADDTVQFSMPMVPTFGQPADLSAPSNLTFGSLAVPPGGQVFQFTSPQASAFPPAQSQFPASVSFTPGGSFSLGSGGDKAGRKYIKAKREKHRKK